MAAAAAASPPLAGAIAADAPVSADGAEAIAEADAEASAAGVVVVVVVVVSSFFWQAARATAATKVANRSDFFMNFLEENWFDQYR